MEISRDIFQMPFWSMDVKEALARLGSSSDGISEEEARDRRQQLGENALSESKKYSPLGLFLRQFKSPLIVILAAAAVVSIALGKMGDAAVITLAILVNVSLGFYQENKAERALSHLKTYLEERSRVLRSGKEKEVDVKEITVGDIIHLSSGSRVGADARLISAKELLCDEAVLTGESLPVDKISEPINPAAIVAERKNMVFGGTLVVQGSGLAVVCATGIHTEFGKIARMVEESEKEETPLQRSMKKLSWSLAVFLVGMVGVVFFLGISSGQSFTDMFFIAVAMAVGAVPEGLPIALTVVMAVGVERLARRNGIVRKLIAVETLGSVSVILTDKTGTLTQARMALERIVSLKDLAEAPLKTKKDKKNSNEEKQILSLALISTDVIKGTQPGKKESIFLGRPLEISLAKEGEARGLDASTLKEKSNSQEWEPFDSVKKFSVSFLKRGISEVSTHVSSGEAALVFFGAPEVLLSLSIMDKREYIQALENVERMAHLGERVLGVAVKKIKGRPKDHDWKNLSFAGVISFRDPLRPEAREAMDQVSQFGIRVAIVTGDHKGTATALAHDLGWKIAEHEVLEGKDIKAMSSSELVEASKRVKIFARVSPEDKVKILRAFKEGGDLTAMTGDGVNDAPILKEADIGVAVGSGTDVAKDVADLVLLDDNFKTIAVAIEEGRKILSNIKKTVVYLLSNALDGVFLIGGSIILGLPLPLSALQILWVNFFTDSFPAVAFAFEHSFFDLPRRKSKKNLVFDARVVGLLIAIGLCTSVLLFVLYAWLLGLGYEEQLVKTFIFGAFGLYTLFLAFALKDLKRSILSFKRQFFSNRMMLGGVFVGLLMMVSAIYFPPLSAILGTTPLPFWWAMGVIGVGIFNVAVAEVTKWFFRGY